MATTDDRADSTEAKLDELGRLRDEAAHQGSERSVERQRKQGKLLARERLEALLDPGSFVELDRYVRHRNPYFDMMENRPYGDAVVTGHGTIFGRKVFVFSQDFTDLRRLALRGLRREDLQGHGPGRQVRLPADRDQRLGRGADPGRRRLARRLRRDLLAERPGLRGDPAVQPDHGPLRGRRRLLARDDGLRLHGRRTRSYMFITGPDVVKTVTGEEVTFEELGGAATHATKSGVAHFVAADEQACLEDARYLLSFLPQNNLDPPPFFAPSDPPGGRIPSSTH